MIENHVPDGTFVDAVAKLAKPDIRLLDLPLGQKLLVGEDGTQTVYGEAKEPTPETLHLNTLSGLVDAYNAKLNGDKDVLIHILSENDVRIITPSVGEHRQQFLYAVSAPIVPSLQNRVFHEVDLFILNMQTNFEPSADRQRALEYVGKLTSGLKSDIVDDGVTQVVTSVKGVSRAEQSTFLNPVQLSPFRTFSEIAQPESPFVLRIKQAKGADDTLTATAALFEADGGAWKTEAIQSIGDFLRDKLPDAVILA